MSTACPSVPMAMASSSMGASGRTAAATMSGSRRVRIPLPVGLNWRIQRAACRSCAARCPSACAGQGEQHQRSGAPGRDPAEDGDGLQPRVKPLHGEPGQGGRSRRGGRRWSGISVLAAGCGVVPPPAVAGGGGGSGGAMLDPFAVDAFAGAEAFDQFGGDLLGLW